MLFREASSHVVDRSLLSTRTLRTIKQRHRVSVCLPCHICHCKYFQVTIGVRTNHHHEALHGRWGGTPCRGRVLHRSRSPRRGARSRPHLACHNHIAALLPPPPPPAPVAPAASAAPAGPASNIMGKQKAAMQPTSKRAEQCQQHCHMTSELHMRIV